LTWPYGSARSRSEHRIPRISLKCQRELSKRNEAHDR